jgi:hypothetical protein
MYIVQYFYERIQIIYSYKDESIAICKFGTSNYLRHLRENHNLVISSKVQSEVTKYPIDSPELNAIHHKIVKFIYKDLQPLCIVTDEGFVALLNHLCPQYQIPSRPFLVDKVFTKKYQMLKVRLLL